MSGSTSAVDSHQEGVNVRERKKQSGAVLELRRRKGPDGYLTLLWFTRDALFHCFSVLLSPLNRMPLVFHHRLSSSERLLSPFSLVAYIYRFIDI